LQHDDNWPEISIDPQRESQGSSTSHRLSEIEPLMCAGACRLPPQSGCVCLPTLDRPLLCSTVGVKAPMYTSDATRACLRWWQEQSRHKRSRNTCTLVLAIPSYGCTTIETRLCYLRAAESSSPKGIIQAEARAQAVQGPQLVAGSQANGLVSEHLVTAL
jgi:hypothetical protein